MNRPAKLTALLASAGLSLLFMIVYGGCNWITAHRTDVGTWSYSWEHLIPFVPVMIVPYMSIDLFFVAAPFLCNSRAELRTFACRITFAILVAGACFLLMPLKMTAACPPVNGWLGVLFNSLHCFDQPYNLVPSLHITLRTILAALYARHTQGALRKASHVWFSLIGFSTLLTYQHHVIDVIAGFVLAGICFYLFRENQPRLSATRNLRIGNYYFAGGCVCTVMAFIAWPWTGVLLWPAASLCLDDVAYWGIGPAIYRKENGRLPLSALILLAPCLFGQWLSLLLYRRQGNAWDKLTPRLWIGAKLNEQQAQAARKQGVTAVLDLTCEFSESKAFHKLNYLNLPVLDLTELSTAQLREAVDFITRHATSGVVYVHCKAGYSRTAAVAGAYLLASGRAKTVDECLDLMRRARPAIIFRPEVRSALENFLRNGMCESGGNYSLRQRNSRNALPMTIKSEKPIAAAQKIGLINPSAASGTPNAL